MHWPILYLCPGTRCTEFENGLAGPSWCAEYLDGWLVFLNMTLSIKAQVRNTGYFIERSWRDAVARAVNCPFVNSIMIMERRYGSPIPSGLMSRCHWAHAVLPNRQWNLFQLHALWRKVKTYQFEYITQSLIIITKLYNSKILIQCMNMVYCHLSFLASNSRRGRQCH